MRRRTSRWACALACVALMAACGDTPASPTPPAGLMSLAVTPAVLAGGGSVQLTATLTTAAPSTGARIDIGSNDSVAPVPSNLVIAAGAASGSIGSVTRPVTEDHAVTITGTYMGVTQSVLLRVTP